MKVPDIIRKTKGLSLASIVGLSYYKVNLHTKQLNQICACVESYYKLPNGTLSGKAQSSEITVPRHIFCYVAQLEIPNVTQEDIASILNRERSTISNSVKYVKQQLTGKAINSDMEKDIKRILESLHHNHG